MIVVDTNIVAYTFIEGEHTPLMRALWQHDSRWRLPMLWRHEFLNVLTTYTRRGGLELPDANQLWLAARRWCRSMENAVDMATVLQVAVAQDISGYDAQFVALAHSLGVPLISEDARLCRHCPDTVVSTSDYLAA